MPRDVFELRRLLRDGMSISVSSNDYEYIELKRLARYASEGEAHLTITDNGILSRWQINHISEEGKGSVSFNLS